MWHGVLLFLLGLLTGLVEQRFTNVRMGLAAHLEGVMNGTFLIALGAICTEVSLPPLAKGATYWVVLYGTYANWLFTTLAAVFVQRHQIQLSLRVIRDNLGRKVLLGRDS